MHMNIIILYFKQFLCLGSHKVESIVIFAICITFGMRLWLKATSFLDFHNGPIWSMYKQMEFISDLLSLIACI